MEYQQLIVSTENHVCTIKINNPATLNALNTSLLKELDVALDEVEKDPEIYVLVITGEGRAFVAGADITEMADLNAAQGKRFGDFGAMVFRKIETLSKPVIAAINGFTLGGGCELAIACDIRIASENAKFGQPEVGLGITTGFSATYRLPRIVGVAKAKELLFTGNVIGAAEALEIGLVNQVVKPEELMEKTMQMAVTIASKAPIAVKYTKEAIEYGLNHDAESAIDHETDVFGSCFSTNDQKEGMKAFINKQKPVFRNR
ncbi:MAG: enoyl-CoA hydratase-related protein [Bacteroidales bacterium]